MLIRQALGRLTLAARTQFVLCAVTAILWLPPSAVIAADDPLPSWNEGSAKPAIVHFMSRATTPGGAEFVPPDERIAVFDNDGTLWCEQPMYVQLAFAVDRVKALAPQHPEWKEKEPFASLLKGDLQRVAAAGEKGWWKSSWRPMRA